MPPQAAQPRGLHAARCMGMPWRAVRPQRPRVGARACHASFAQTSCKKPRSRLQSAVQGSQHETEECSSVAGVIDAVVLTWLASRNKSLFAAKCLVETVLQCYQRRLLVDDLQVPLQMKVLQSATEVMAPMEQDVLLSWIMLIMATAQQLGVPCSSQRSGGGAPAAAAAAAAASAAPPEPAPSSTDPAAPPAGAAERREVPAAITQRYTSQVSGLMQYVKNTLDLYEKQGYTLERVQSLQAAVNQEQPGRSQFLELMQQYTRLVLITVEVVAALQLPTSFHLTNPHSLTAPSGYTGSIWPELLAQPDEGAGSSSSTTTTTTSSSSASSGGAAAARLPAPSASAGSADEASAAPASGPASAPAGGPAARLVSPARAYALRLLMSWMGAVLGSSYSRQQFVRCAFEAYQEGFAAGALAQQLAEEEFLQSGGLIPVPGPQVLVEVNAQLFSQWLSCAYMAWAQLGVPFPRAAEQTGWAWAGPAGDEVTANALAGFTASAIRRLEAERNSSSDIDADLLLVGAVAQEDPLATKIKSDPAAAASLEAVQAALSREVLERRTLRGRPLPPMVRVPDEQLAATSSGLLVWRQLMEVVQEACALASAAAEAE